MYVCIYLLLFVLCFVVNSVSLSNVLMYGLLCVQSTSRSMTRREYQRPWKTQTCGNWLIDVQLMKMDNVSQLLLVIPPPLPRPNKHNQFSGLAQFTVDTLFCFVFVNVCLCVRRQGVCVCVCVCVRMYVIVCMCVCMPTHACAV